MEIFTGMWAWVKYPCLIIGVFILPYALACIVWALIYRKKGLRKKRGNHTAVKKKPWWVRLYWEAPRQWVLDRLMEEPDFFHPCGLVIFTGMQGSGKTSALVEYTMRLQKEYPKVKVLSNMGYTGTTEELSDWRQLLDFKNAHKGVIVQMDETQNWFSSKQSKNFPPEMLSVVTQNRKNRRIILGTAQSFYMLAKDIRTQCTEVRKCLTVMGCITVVHRVRAVCDSAGEVKEWKHVGWYFFVHDKELRESYDTYRVIDSLSRSGFTEKVVVRPQEP